jgi:uncharacterized membrane protein YgdD (TMEM256/DUF423 family)
MSEDVSASRSLGVAVGAGGAAGRIQAAVEELLSQVLQVAVSYQFVCMAQHFICILSCQLTSQEKFIYMLAHIR